MVHLMVARIEYRAGAAACWVINEVDYFEYSCGPFQSGRIDKASIAAIGVSDDRHLTRMVGGARSAQRLMGVKDGLGGLIIAYSTPGKSTPKMATVTFDFGLDECQAFVNALIEEFDDRYVGIDTRNGLMKKMGVSRLKENLIIAGVLIAVALFALLMTMR